MCKMKKAGFPFPTPGPAEFWQAAVVAGREYSTVQYGAVRCSTVHYGIVQYGVLRYSTVHYIVQYSTVHSQSPNNGLLKYNGAIYPPRQSVFPSES